jgi:hypothetical protein
MACIYTNISPHKVSLEYDVTYIKLDNNTYTRYNESMGKFHVNIYREV